MTAARRGKPGGAAWLMTVSGRNLQAMAVWPALLHAKDEL
jgi:hypothetical protein